MTWAPAPQAEWVQEANRGERPEYRPDSAPFDGDRARADAEHRAGVTLDAPDVIDPLRVFCTALEAEADLTSLGRWATQRYLNRLLDVRLQLDALAEAEPAIAEAPVVAPVFVIGAPRTGTTVMHRLLSVDPAHRVPEGWEFLWPAPPPETQTEADDPRIALAADELGFPQSVAEGLSSIHAYSARMPKECLSAMALSFRTEEFVSRYHVPSYIDWLQQADLAPAYTMHRWVLQVLQHRMPARRWVLKSPVHLQGLPELMATYPDARFVFTHREPAAVLASVSSLIATLRSAFSANVDPMAIGRYHFDLYRRSLDDLVDHVDGGLIPAERAVHIGHRDVVADPLRTLETVYDGLGLEFSAGVRDAAVAETNRRRPDALGAHSYEPDDFGLDPTEIDEGFGRYRHRFLEQP
ncbi:MAG: sulfotransferase family protein [Acidimicrobiales bacterium]